MEYVPISLSIFDKARLMAFNTDNSEFLGMIAPAIRRNVSDGQSFYLKDDPSVRCFRYGIDSDGSDYIVTSSGRRIPLSKSRSLTTVIFDKLSNNQFSQSIDRVKNVFRFPEIND